MSSDLSVNLPEMGAETTTVPREAAVVPLIGRLDGEAGLRLLEQARHALAAGATRLDIDLSEVTAYTPAGSAALLACRDLPCPDDGATVADVHYRTSRGPGRDALLEAFAGVRDDHGDDAVGHEGDPPGVDLRSV